MRVLYANQTARVSGAERSLLDLITRLPSDVDPVVAAPRGELRGELEAGGIPWVEIPATEISFRLHPVHTARGVANLVAGGRALRAEVRRLRPQIVHANTTRAGLGAIAGRLGHGPPLITHVRDWVPEGRVPAATLRAVELGARAVIANSRFVAAQLPGGRRAAPVHVIHDAVDTARFASARRNRAEHRRELGLADGETAMLVVAQLTPWKGQDDAIRALGRLKQRQPRIRLLLAGSAKFDAPGGRFDTVAFEAELRELARGLGVLEQVEFLGERRDVPALMAAADLLLVPSWKEAFGRVVVEGMAAGLPVVATDTGGPSELIRDGIEGLVLPPRRPELWAEEIGALLADGQRMRELGEAGTGRAAADLDPDRLVAEVVSVYDEIAGE